MSKNTSPLPEGGLIRKEISAMPAQEHTAIVRQVVGYDRLVGEQASRQLTELYRALRRSRQLFSTLDEAAGETP